MLKVLVTGVKGQLGSELNALVALSPEYKSEDFFFTDRETLDITNERAIEAFLEKNSITHIVNCAAYTAVDKAETDEAHANNINHLAVSYLANFAKDKALPLIHISTDYVFDGTQHTPYVETDSTKPNGVYGSTKLAGEKSMQDINPLNSIIIRTSWVYSSFGANFIKTMLRLGNERDELGVIFDQVGTPTYAKDLAQAILNILPQVQNDKVEIYNYSNEGVCSWYDFAKAIFELSKVDCKVNSIETKEYPTPATRPHYALLNKSKIKQTFNIEIPYWKDSLDECLNTMGERK